MPRKPRYFIPDITTHIVQRGHNEGPVFFKEKDYKFYLEFLRKASRRYSCAIHAYLLIENQIRILATPSTEDGVSRMMQYIGRYYVSYINGENNSSGTLWDGRFRSCIVQDTDPYILSSMRYIELTPVRFGWVGDPAEIRWSSHHHNAYGRHDDLITPHVSYQKLGNTTTERYGSYYAFCREKTEEIESAEICSAWRSGTPLGNENFKRMIERRLNIRVRSKKPGRPKKSGSSIDKSLMLFGYNLVKNYAFKTAKR